MEAPLLLEVLLPFDQSVFRLHERVFRVTTMTEGTTLAMLQLLLLWLDLALRAIITMSNFDDENNMDHL